MLGIETGASLPVLADEYAESPLLIAASVDQTLSLCCQGGRRTREPKREGPTVLRVTFPIHTAGPGSGLTPPWVLPPQLSSLGFSGLLCCRGTTTLALLHGSYLSSF